MEKIRKDKKSYAEDMLADVKQTMVTVSATVTVLECMAVNPWMWMKQMSIAP